MDEIADIKRRAGIVEFGHPPPGWEPNKTPPMSSQLYAIARAAMGGGRLDKRQIETIWRAHELLKSMDK